MKPKIVLTLLIALGLSIHTEAGIRPSFRLEYSAWSATDIVLVTAAEKIDGNLRVLEVWKGTLHERRRGVD